MDFSFLGSGSISNSFFFFQNLSNLNNKSSVIAVSCPLNSFLKWSDDVQSFIFGSPCQHHLEELCVEGEAWLHQGFHILLLHGGEWILSAQVEKKLKRLIRLCYFFFCSVSFRWLKRTIFLHGSHVSFSAHLGGQRVWGSGLQQNSSGLHLTLSGRDVEGSVAVCGGSIRVGHMLQQKLDNIGFP